MRKLGRIGALALAFVIVAAVAAPVVMANDVTVGDFIQRLARAKNLNATDAAIAADSLRAVGVSVPANLRFSDRLTEGHVAVIARNAGLNVRTSSPEANFDDAMVDRFFVSFASELGDVDDDPILGLGKDKDGDEEDKDKGKGKGKNGRTPSEPE